MAEKVDQMDPDEKIVEIAIERLRVFENHPFRVEMDSQMKDLQDSIKKYGIITPVIVRPRKEGYFDCIAYNCCCWNPRRICNRYIFEKCRHVYGICISGCCFYSFCCCYVYA